MIKFRLATAEGELLAEKTYSTINYVPEQSGPKSQFSDHELI